MGEWQPFSTAPKDGLGGVGPEFIAAQYLICGLWNHVFVRYKQGVLVHSWDHAPVKPAEFDPTHWMPIPTPPQDAQAEGER